MQLDKQIIASIFSDNKTMSTRSKTQKKDSPQKISKRQKKEMRKDAQDQKYLEEAEALQKDIVVMERELRQAGVKFDSVLPSNPLEEMEEELNSDSDGGDDPYHELQRMKEKFELTQIMHEHHQETIRKALPNNSVTNDTSNTSKSASSSTTARHRQNNLINKVVYNQPPRDQTNLNQHQPVINQDPPTSDLLTNQQQSTTMDTVTNHQASPTLTMDQIEHQNCNKLLQGQQSIVHTVPCDLTGKLKPELQQTFDMECSKANSIFGRAANCTNNLENRKLLLNTLVTPECQQQILAIINSKITDSNLEFDDLCDISVKSIYEHLQEYLSARANNVNTSETSTERVQKMALQTIERLANLSFDANNPNVRQETQTQLTSITGIYTQDSNFTAAAFKDGFNPNWAEKMHDKLKNSRPGGIINFTVTKQTKTTMIPLSAPIRMLTHNSCKNDTNTTRYSSKLGRGSKPV